MSDASEFPGGAADVAERLASALDSQGIEYAFGGAIALAFWGEPRGRNTSTRVP